MRSTSFRRMAGALCLISGMALTGCSFAPEYSRPDMEVPETWSKAPYDLPQGSERLEVAWWKRFNDPVLDKMVEKALLYNQNLAVAVARVDKARAFMGLSRADFFPTVGGAAGAARARVTDGDIAAGTALSQILTGMGKPMSAPGHTNSMFNAGLQAGWELDLWGKVKNSTEAARQQLLATEAGQRGVALTIAGQTVQAYIDLRSFDAQLAIAKRTLASREEALRIYRARYDEGLISELDFLRAKTEVDIVRSSLYATQYQVSMAESALQVLTGQSPRDIFEASPERGLALHAIPSAPQLPVGMPSDLLERRPDLVAAEAMLKAANFKIGVAKAAWFPSISLTGQLGSQSMELDDLFSGGTDMWALQGGLSLPIFTFGRISSNVKISEAAQREAAASYIASVQQAFKDVRDALSVQDRTVYVVRSLTSVVNSLRKATDLARLRYDNGYASYLDVLDAERSLFDAEIQLANVRAAHLKSIVSVCMALGGGWDEKDLPGSDAAATPSDKAEAAAKAE